MVVYSRGLMMIMTIVLVSFSHAVVLDGLFVYLVFLCVESTPNLLFGLAVLIVRLVLNTHHERIDHWGG